MFASQIVCIVYRRPGERYVVRWWRTAGLSTCLHESKYYCGENTCCRNHNSLSCPVAEVPATLAAGVDARERMDRRVWDEATAAVCCVATTNDSAADNAHHRRDVLSVAVAILVHDLWIRNRGPASRCSNCYNPRYSVVLSARGISVSRARVLVLYEIWMIEWYIVSINKKKG